MKYIIKLASLAAVLLIWGITNPVLGQNFHWAQALPALPFGANSIFENEVGSDSYGNSYYSGAFTNSLQIGTVTVHLPGDNLFVAKFDRNGNVVWVKPFQSSGVFAGSLLMAITQLKVDPAGNCYFAGHFESPITFGSILLDPLPSNSLDIFLVKLDPSGNVIWAKHGASGDTEQVQSLSLDGTGNVYITGYTYGGLQYDGTGIANGVGEGFLIKADQNGNFVWGRNIATNRLSVGVKQNGEGYIAGGFSLPVLNLGNGVTVVNDSSALGGGETAFAAAFDLNGQFQWAHVIGGSWAGYARALQLRADAAGNMFVAGTYIDSVRFGTGSSAITLDGSGDEDYFLFKVNSAGFALWGKGILNLGAYQATTNWAPKLQLELDGYGNPVVANSHYGPVQLDAGNQFTPISASTAEILITKYHSNGNLIWYTPIGGTAEEVITGLSVNAAGDIVVTGELSALAGGASTQFGSLTLPTTVKGAFIARISDVTNRIAGSVYLDQNNSGIQDAGEPGVPYLRVQLQNGQSVFTNANGQFAAYTDTGSFQITLPQVPSYFTNSTGTHTATFTGINQSDTTNYFALQPQGIAQDLRLDIVELNPARPGFVYHTRLSYRNAGNTVMSGSVKLVTNNVLTLITAVPGATIVSGDTLMWNFSALQPFEARHISVNWQVPASASIGDTITVFGKIDPSAADQNLEDNSLASTVIVQGSFDPNDKLVSHRILTLAQVAAGKWLNYTVRFQNTGTDTAFFAVVRDELSPLLDMNTLEVISSSHPFTMQLTGPISVEWDFGTILLPDSNTNEPLSHGYIQYRIKPLPTLTLGQHINTHANIFFDFNAPVITNITDTEVGVVTGVVEQLKQQQIIVWPNPSDGRFMLQLPQKGKGVMQIRLVNILGEVVHEESRSVASGQELNLEKIAAGVYLMQVYQNGKSYTSKVVLQK